MFDRPPAPSTLLLLAVCCGCGDQASAPPAGPVVVDGRTMGTTYVVKLAGPVIGLTQQETRDAIQAALAAIEARMSTYRDDSEVSRFNRSTDRQWFAISRQTAEVVDRSLDVARRTDGALDVTVGPLVELWGFGPKRRKIRQTPSPQAVAEVMTITGPSRFELRRDPPALRKTDPRVQIDLSAVAKGYAVDRVAELLIERGAGDFMIEVGGEIRTAGAKADGSPWTVGIEAPTSDSRQLLRTFPLIDSSLATSGDYRNFHTIDGQRYSHAIDPRTGRPVAHSLVSVSVVADSCAEADALATALLVMGPDGAEQFARQHALPALMVLRREDGFQQRGTPEFWRLCE